MTDEANSDKKYIWITAAVFLGILVILFFVGLFLDVKRDAPLLPGFYWIANIAAATAAGILCSNTISGFLRVQLERKFGTQGRIAVQASGGFAVFVLVIMMNPQSSMFKLADTVFSNLARECQSAVDNPDSNPNGMALCKSLVASYPNRPEPLRLLARLIHKRKRSAGFEQASDLYRKSVSLYGIDPDNIKLDKANYAHLSVYDRTQLSVSISGFCVSQADNILNKYSSGAISTEDLKIKLDEVEAAIELNLKVIGNTGDPFIIGRMLDAKGKIGLYRHFIFRPKENRYLPASVEAYKAAIELDPYYVLLLEFHLFLTSVAESNHFGQSSIDNREAFQRFLRSWSDYVESRDNMKELAAFRVYMKAMLKNSREEMFRISRPFGSKLFVGDVVLSFLTNNEDLKGEFELKIESL